MLCIMNIEFPLSHKKTSLLYYYYIHNRSILYQEIGQTDVVSDNFCNQFI